MSESCSLCTLEQNCIEAAISTKRAALALKQAETHESALTDKLDELQHQLLQLELKDIHAERSAMPLSVALANHKENTNTELTKEDEQYFARIPAQITRGSVHTPSRYLRPTRGDIVMITRQYTSKIPNLNFPQLNVIGTVKHSEPQQGRIEITVEPNKTIEKSWKNTVTLLKEPDYERAHINDMQPLPK